jgi:hypothetical protein
MHYLVVDILVVRYIYRDETAEQISKKLAWVTDRIGYSSPRGSEIVA